MFLVDYNGDFIDIPVLITNIQGTTGDRPNQSSDQSKWVLTRRFFMFDTLSGIRDGEYPSGQPQTVVYPASITLIIQLDRKNKEMINVPVLKIEYKARAL